MNQPERLQGKLMEAPDTVMRGSLMDYKDVFLKQDVANAVAWVRMMICTCKSQKCRHKLLIDEAFPDVVEGEKKEVNINADAKTGS